MSNTITPIPIFINQESPKCPKCGKDEQKKEVCAHCGYEYPEEEGYSLGVKICGVLMIVFIIWLICTLVWWLADQDTFGDKRTLWEIIKIQGEFIWNLRHKII